MHTLCLERSDPIFPPLLCSYFYWRLRRRLAEEDGVRRLAAADASLDRKARLAIVNSVVAAEVDASNDQAVAAALEKGHADLVVRVHAARQNSIAQSVADMVASGDASAVLEGLKRAKGESLTAEQIALLSSVFSQ